MTVSSKPTDTQAAVLKFIVDFRKANQMPPTRAEIARKFGWRSINAAEDTVRALARKGYIRLTPGVSRGIFVLRESA